jgi:DNA-binding CsgD family transcriptional regulator
MTNKGNGKTFQWLQDHLDYDGNYCLIWPFYRNPNGYGQMGHNGESHWAHRLMCELVNGPPPTPEHDAAHSCGNGAGGCAHPKHLSWKTKTGNLLDCREHGTQARNVHGNAGRLSPDQVQQIRDLKGKKTQAEIALIFGIHEPSVRDIFLGRTYSRPSKIKHWKPEEERRLRASIAEGMNFSQISKVMGRSVGAVSGHAYRLGLRSGQPVQKTVP